MLGIRRLLAPLACRASGGTIPPYTPGGELGGSVPCMLLAPARHHWIMESGIGGTVAEHVTVRVLINVGDQAHVVTPTRDYLDPVVMPAATIAEQAGLPENELPGRKFYAVQDGDRLTGFRLVHDPRV